MAAFAIDNDVPLPKRRGGRPRDSKTAEFPFAAMAVGSSFFVPGISNAVAAAANTFTFLNRHLGVRFTTRAFDQDPKTKLPGHRVWRTR